MGTFQWWYQVLGTVAGSLSLLLAFVTHAVRSGRSERQRTRHKVLALDYLHGIASRGGIAGRPGVTSPEPAAHAHVMTAVTSVSGAHVADLCTACGQSAYTTWAETGWDPEEPDVRKPEPLIKAEMIAPGTITAAGTAMAEFSKALDLFTRAMKTSFPVPPQVMELSAESRRVREAVRREERRVQRAAREGREFRERLARELEADGYGLLARDATARKQREYPPIDRRLD